MNLYKEVSEGDLMIEIEKIFNNNLIRNPADRSFVEDAILNLSRRRAKQEIRKYFYDHESCNAFYSEVKKLYHALWEIRQGRKIYTDL